MTSYANRFIAIVLLVTACTATATPPIDFVSLDSTEALRGVNALKATARGQFVASKSGIDLEYLNELFHDLLPRPGLKKYATRIRQRDFDSACFELSAGIKDVELIFKTFSDKRVPCSYIGMIKDKFLSALAYGMEHKDWSSIYEITRMNAGLK